MHASFAACVALTSFLWCLLLVTNVESKGCELAKGEVAALKDFYHSTGGDQWRLQDNWLKGNPCGGKQGANNWIGVLCGRCDAQGWRHVEVLAMEWNNLVGTVPKSVGVFRELAVLNLGTNGLTGALPAEISMLKKLRVLKVSYNKMDGKLPADLLKLSGLEMLDLAYNDFVADLNALLDAYPKMRKLVLRGNRGFSGDLGKAQRALRKMKRLKVFDLHWNNVGGVLPRALFNLPELEEITLSANHISGAFPRSIRLPKLHTLNLRGNFINGTLPSSFGSLANLVALDLEKNYLSGSLPASIGQLTALTEVKINNNVFTGALPEGLYNLESLTLLDVSNNEFGGTLSSAVGQLTRLETLGMHSCKLTGEIPSELGALTALKSLALQNNRFTGSIPSTVGQMTSLEELSVRENHIWGVLPSTLGHLHQLKLLEANDNKLTGSIPEEIGNCEALEALLLHDNRLDGTVPSLLGVLAKLKKLALHNNALQGDGIPEFFSQLSALEDVTLHNNNFKGNPFPVIDSTSNTPYNKYSQCDELTDGSGTPRRSYFRVCGTRNDFYVDVLVLDKFPWLETHGDNWHTCYGKCKRNRVYGQHFSYQRTSRYQDMYQVADKAVFAALMERQRDIFGSAFDFHPPTFRMPYQLDEWKKEHAKHPEGYWLLKPSISCCGQNIRLIQGPLDPSMPVDLGNWIIQRFVHPPHLVFDHKYVLRLFGIVTSFSPLRLYLYPDGDVFYTHANYTLDPERTSKSRGYFITDYFFTHKQRDFFTSSTHLFAHFKKLGLNTDKMWKDLQDVAVKALQGSEIVMRHQQNLYSQQRLSVYEVVGYDIVYDHNLKPWVCEVNTTPNLGLEINKANDPIVHEEDFHLKTLIMQDTLAMVGVVSRDDNPLPPILRREPSACELTVERVLHEQHLRVNESLYCSGLQDFQCITEEEVQLLKEYECEYQRRGGFVPLFPDTRAEEYIHFFPVPRRENFLMVWWYNLRRERELAAGIDSTAGPLPWSRSDVRRQFREMNLTDAQWKKRGVTQNQATLKWNTDEEGIMPDPEKEDNYFLDDEDQFSPDEFPEDKKWDEAEVTDLTGDDTAAAAENSAGADDPLKDIPPTTRDGKVPDYGADDTTVAGKGGAEPLQTHGAPEDVPDWVKQYKADPNGNVQVDPSNAGGGQWQMYTEDKFDEAAWQKDAEKYEEDYKQKHPDDAVPTAK